ncbi:MAG: MaoC family dehydratase [Deltaproteobacteria bacterium]|nr:MaoC family dehydratase [Deltaproteobacteria bacterium]MBW1816097.1 MaoC family dehydratase [Deltaproteobacteria bacterium]
MGNLTFDSVHVGDTLPSISNTVTQETFWKNAVASFDYNPVHCDPEWVATAQPFGIPVTVAHGMMTMSFMVTVATNWAVPSMLKVSKMTSRFTKPVPAGTIVICSGSVTEKHIISPGKNFVIVDLKAESQDGELLGMCEARVVFPD